MAEEVTRTLPFSRPGGELGIGIPSLEIVSGAPARTFRLTKATCLIGRGDSADLFLDADGVSRKHSKIVNTGTDINLIDLGSTNGTFLNNKRIDVASLREGDRIQVGQVVMQFVYEQVTSPAIKAPAAGRTEGRPPIEKVLSAREHEVAQLVAEGLTNADIGRQLKISPRTVATHLANIYERLDIHSRAALAKYVVESRLGLE